MPPSQKRLDVYMSEGVMAIVAPKGRKPLAADALVRLIRSGCDTLPD